MFDAMLQNATRICEAKHGTLFLFADGDVSAGRSHMALPLRRSLQGHVCNATPFNQRTAPASVECCSAKATVQIADVQTDKDLSARTSAPRSRRA